MNNHTQQQTWTQLEQDFSNITDRLGEPIDPGILQAVVGLNALGFITRQSCEGHLDHGEAAPWIDIEVEQPADYQQRYDHAQSLFDQAKQFQQTGGEDMEIRKLYRNGHAIIDELRRPLVAKAYQMSLLLDDFYANRRIPHHQQLTMIMRGQNFRLQSQGACTQEALTEDITAQRLSVYQQEMHDFTNFLKNQFFTN